MFPDGACAFGVEISPSELASCFGSSHAASCVCRSPGPISVSVRQVQTRGASRSSGGGAIGGGFSGLWLRRWHEESLVRKC